MICIRFLIGIVEFFYLLGFEIENFFDFDMDLISKFIMGLVVFLVFWLGYKNFVIIFVEGEGVIF